MIILVGIVITLGCIMAGYLMEHGNLHLLWQPAELVIIFGAVIGATTIASPGHVLPLVLKGFKQLFGKGEGKEFFVDLLVLLYEIFTKSRKEGILSLEKDIEAPDQSPIFQNHPHILSDKPILDFISDNIRLVVLGVSPEEIGDLLEIDIDANKHESMVASSTIATSADALPGLGIVAAVLGVVITMGKMSEPPEVLGESIGAALVGTFLGVLCCYGIVGPMAKNLEHKVKEREICFNIVKAAIARFEANPNLIVEIARREIPNSARPSFKELEEEIKKWKDKK